jgi:hypothetical protein
MGRHRELLRNRRFALVESFGLNFTAPETRAECVGNLSYCYGPATLVPFRPPKRRGEWSMLEGDMVMMYESRASYSE